MKNISIEKFNNFLSWAYKNNYFYSENNEKSGWLSRDNIINIGNFDQRNKLRITTGKLFEEFCNSK